MSPHEEPLGPPPAATTSHQHLESVMGQMVECLRLGWSGAEFIAICEKFHSALAAHFLSEEEALKVVDFAGLEAHAQLHRDILERVGKGITELRQENSVSARFGFLGQMEDYILSHELIDDHDHHAIGAG